MINILVVDDSETEAAIITTIIESQSDMSVIGVARNGEEAIEQTLRLNPDLITMDIQMPIMDGLEATRRIMAGNPTPIVVISSTVSKDSVQSTFKILEAGALDALAKPTNIFIPAFEEERQHIIQTLRIMSEIKVARKRYTSTQMKSPFGKSTLISSSKSEQQYEVVSLGISVGGPQTLKKIFSQLPHNFALPIVIVQHMSPGFIGGYAEWLASYSKLAVKCADDMERIKNGTIYLAPDDHHLIIERIHGHLHAKLVKGEVIDGFYPSITALLKSVTKACGERAIGGLLTGMGSDGAQGLLEMKRAHSHTFIQDKESCIVFGMAAVAQSLGAVDEVIQLDNIADRLQQLSRSMPREP